ncbi:hypothetical protein MYU51_006603 [Penicillium brevicompactum]
MTNHLEHDGLAEFANDSEMIQWDPSLDFFHFVGDQFSSLDDDPSYGAFQQVPSPSMSPLPLPLAYVPQAMTAPATPAPPTPASFKPLPKVSGDPYENLSTVDDGASEAPLSEHTGAPCGSTQSVMSSTGDERETVNSHEDNERHASHGRVSMGVKSRASSNAFKCRWERCEYSGGFSGAAALLRHIKTKHICPNTFECPDEQCFRSFNRKDNLVAHMRNVHRGGA